MSPAGMGCWLLGLDGSATPTSIPGLQLWLNGRTGVITSGSSVTQWNDQSGNGNNFNQVAGGDQPTTGTINGKSAINFVAASAQFFNPTTTNNLISATAFTIFCVWKYTGSITYSSGSTISSMPVMLYFGSGGANATAIGAAQDSTPTNVDAFTATTYAFATTASQNAVGLYANPHQSYHAFDGALTYCSIDKGTINSTASSGTLTALNNPLICKGPQSTNEYWNGQIGELLIFSTMLSPSQVSFVQKYLTTQWGF